MNAAQTFHAGNAVGVLINGVVHILKRSSSRFHLDGGGASRQYCCLGSCCDGGLREDVRCVVEEAKSNGATHVVLRTSQHDSNNREVANLGLKLSDVGYHPRNLAEGWKITG